jgi:hypothetical protein
MLQGLKIWRGELYVGPKIWEGASSKGGAKIWGGGGAYAPLPTPLQHAWGVGQMKVDKTNSPPTYLLTSRIIDNCESPECIEMLFA